MCVEEFPLAKKRAAICVQCTIAATAYWSIDDMAEKICS